MLGVRLSVVRRKSFKKRNSLLTRALSISWALLVVCGFAEAQMPGFEVHGQATSVTQYHGRFYSPYLGENSLEPAPETKTSLTMTLFVTLRHKGTELGFAPEVAGGEGFSGVTGIAGFPNGEIPRVAKPTPTPYLGRVYLKQRVSIFTWTFGKVAASDFFDNNAYSHDPRMQFLNWSIMYNGAWDYPADVRGYTVGAVQEVEFLRTVLRVGSFLEPKEANGPHLDLRVSSNHGEAFEVEHVYAKGGIARVLAFVNHADMGTYRTAGQDITLNRRMGNLKYGFGLNLEQRINEHLGVFSRLGWNDGKTESWAFTEIDRSVSAGATLRGSRWKRARDGAGIAMAVNAISGDHRAYLARGGNGFLIGDGKLTNPGRETILEAFYAWQPIRWLTITPDYQVIANPAYNRDRGPVHTLALRVHVAR
jgi:high affinity Mn2+ porin